MSDDAKAIRPLLRRLPLNESAADRKARERQEAESDEAARRHRLRAELGRLSKDELIEYVLASTLVDSSRFHRFLEVFERINTKHKRLKEGRSQAGKSGHEKSEKGRAKRAALVLWKEWQAGKHRRIKTARQFATEVMRNSKVLTNAKSIEGWATQWKKAVARGENPVC